MLIIVEGMDNSGKSTLCQYLAEKYKLLLIANKQRPRNDIEAFHYIMSVISMSLIWDVIVDRWCLISEPIYGPIIRGENLVEDLVSTIEMPEHKLIYCRPPTEAILNFNHREQMSGVEDKGAELLAAYDRWASTVSHVKYDYTNPNYEELELCIKM